MTINTRYQGSAIYRGYGQSNDEDIHDWVRYPKCSLIVQTMGAVSYDVHHRTPFFRCMAAAVEEEQEEEGNCPCNDQDTHDCGANWKPCLLSRTKDATVKHDEAEFDTAKWYNLQELEYELNLAKASVHPRDRISKQRTFSVKMILGARYVNSASGGAPGGSPLV